MSVYATYFQEARRWYQLLELEFQVTVSCLTWLLGATLWSSARAIITLSCRTISPTLVTFLSSAGEAENGRYPRQQCPLWVLN